MSFTDKPELVGEDAWGRALNVCVKTDHLVGDECEVFFSNLEPAWLAPADIDMLDVLAAAEVFVSRTQAKKNWQGPIQIPVGWSDHEVGKKHVKIGIIKPGPVPTDDGHQRDYVHNTLVAVDGVPVEGV